jgi:dsRNA-specific ribonuclease
LAKHVRVGKGERISQAVLEDVLEAIVGAIDRELSFVELCRFTKKTFGPMVQTHKDRPVGESQRADLSDHHRQLIAGLFVQQAQEAGHDSSKWARVAAAGRTEQGVETAVPIGGDIETATIAVDLPTHSED